MCRRMCVCVGASTYFRARRLYTHVIYITRVIRALCEPDGPRAGTRTYILFYSFAPCVRGDIFIDISLVVFFFRASLRDNAIKVTDVIVTGFKLERFV